MLVIYCHSEDKRHQATDVFVLFYTRQHCASKSTGTAIEGCCIRGMCIIWNGHKTVLWGTLIISHVYNWRDVVVLIDGWKYSVVW